MIVANLKIFKTLRTFYFEYSSFPTKVNLGNDGDIYSACSNPISAVLVIVLGITIYKGV